MAEFMSTEERAERFDAAWAIALEWQPLLENAYQYASPNQEDFFEQSSTAEQGESKVRNLYDATAIIGLQQFASSIQNLLMPSFTV